MDVSVVMETMQQRNREMFVVPPYILYVARAFSTLEGIGLSANEDYSIVSEAFPYLSQRLLTDSSPRAKSALRSMVYGTSEEAQLASASPSFSKLASMGEGFASYSTSTGGVPTAAAAAGGGAGGTEASAEAQEALIDVLISADGNYVQELLIDEAAKLADASVRGAIGQAASLPVASGLAQLLRAPKQLAEQTVGRLPLPGPLKSGVDFALAPATILDELANLLPTLGQKNATDEAALAAFNELWETFNAPPPDANDGTASSGEGVTRLASLAPSLETVQTSAGPLLEELGDPESRLRQRLPMIGTLSRRFGATLLRRVATRLEEDASRPGAPGLARSVATTAAAAERSLADLIQPDVGAHADHEGR
jgi:hypothetical protein